MKLEFSIILAGRTMHIAEIGVAITSGQNVTFRLKLTSGSYSAASKTPILTPHMTIIFEIVIFDILAGRA